MCAFVPSSTFLPSRPCHRGPPASPRPVSSPTTTSTPTRCAARSPPPPPPPPIQHVALDLRNLLPQPRGLPAPATPVPAQTAPATPAAPAPGPSSFVTAAVRAVGPAVVRIDTERSVEAPTIIVPPGLEGLFDDPKMKRFFGDDFDGRSAPPKSSRRLERGLGSGFIISEDGVVVTNAHVVKGADKLVVTLTDGRTFKGVVSGTDDVLDLAVVKIDPSQPTSSVVGGQDESELDGSSGGGGLLPGRGMSAFPGLGGGGGGGGGTASAPKKPLPVAKMGSSSALSVGDWCIAIGNPHGLNNTVTLGIVSSLNRSAAEVGFPEKRLNLIQTSAPLNAGNSGGVIANELGEVVGVSTAVRANAEGIGFAIPIDKVKDIVAELASGKTIAHPFLGVKMQTLTPDFARENNSNPNAPAVIPEVNGALVVHVVPESPAARSPGLRRFDIIVGIDGKKCRGVRDVQSIVEGAGVGKRISIQVVRGGDKSKPIDVVVETGDLAAANAAAKPGYSTGPLPWEEPGRHSE